MYLYCMFWETAAGHESIKQQLQGAVDRQRLGHGLMFTGEDGHGVLPMVIDLAQYILAKEHARAAEKVSTLNHVDLHFCFPQHSVAKSEKMDENSFYFLFREMYLNNAYSSLEDWIRQLDSENKQVFISSKQIEDVTAKFDLKSFEGGSKILVIWHADKLNGVASNKLLKFLEEPPQNTYIFLTCPNPDDLLATVRSRVQEVHIPRPSDSTIARYLSEKFDKEFTAENPLRRAHGRARTGAARAEARCPGRLEPRPRHWPQAPGRGCAGTRLPYRPGRTGGRQHRGPPLLRQHRHPFRVRAGQGIGRAGRAPAAVLDGFARHPRRAAAGRAGTAGQGARRQGHHLAAPHAGRAGRRRDRHPRDADPPAPGARQ